MRLTCYTLSVLIGLASLAGCSSQPVQQIKGIFQSKGEPELQTGIKLYEDGRYKEALTSFQGALSAGLRADDQVIANKYLAFISCVSGRERQCRAYFSRALELNPSFELEPAEAGHPIWGPVFRSVKARR
jgi:hypothetical protein